MAPWLIWSAVAGGAYAGYKYFFPGPPVLQSVRRITPAPVITAVGHPIVPAGTPVQIVVPVVSKPPTLGVTTVPIPPGNLPSANTGLSAIQTMLDNIQSAPQIITPTGNSNLAIQTIQDIQKALNTLALASPALVVDGKAGPLTLAAIRNFQTMTGVAPDGTINAVLKTEMETALGNLAGVGAAIGLHPDVQTASSNNARNLGSVGVPVKSPKDVQHALNMLGASPLLVEDGKLGPKSVAAIKAFQVVHALVADGIPGPKTLTALSIALAPSPPIAGEPTSASSEMSGVALHRPLHHPAPPVIRTKKHNVRK